jgi:archaemetzincin
MSAESAAHPVRELHVVTVGSFPTELARGVVARVSRRVRVPCILRPPPLDDELPYLAHRDQVDADRLLILLEKAFTAESALQVALTLSDIGSPLFTFFFGRARLHGTTALVSLARLDPAYYGLPTNSEVALQRAVSEILHELGHNLGLQHCGDSACLMHLTGSVEAIDVRGTSYCPSCAEQLPRGLLAPAAYRR